MHAKRTPPETARQAVGDQYEHFTRFESYQICRHTAKMSGFEKNWFLTRTDRFDACKLLSDTVITTRVQYSGECQKSNIDTSSPIWETLAAQESKKKARKEKNAE